MGHKARRILLTSFLLACLLPWGPARAARTPGALVGPVRLVPDRTSTISVGGLHRFFGTVGIGSASDGLFVTNRLSVERYLLGLQEVPPGWPEEALRAQAVAARTYALWTLARPAAGAAATYGFDICASVECQVFAGAEVVATPDGRRWADAVQDTAGQAVLYRGLPILARYHSTSGGTTLDNSQAFPGDPDYPYLQGVPSTSEGGSPLYRWRAHFPIDRLQRMLRAAGVWTAAHGRLQGASSVPSSAGLHYPDVVLRGTKARLRTDAESLRDILRDEAPGLYPGEYPSPWPTTSGRLPETLPSNRITVRTSSRVAVVTGRGWGHGTGMSQWGAHGMALEGSTYPEILGHYYRGTSVGQAEVPPSISVGVAWGRSAVVATGAFDVVDGRGRVAIRDALGSWSFSPGGDGVVTVEPPPGHALPLRVGIVDAPKTAPAGRRVGITYALSKAARIHVESDSENRSPVQVRRPGRGTIFWEAPEEPGSYEVVLVASAGRNESERRKVAIRVVGEREAAPPAASGSDESVSGGLVRLAIGVLIGGLVIVVLGSRIKR